MSILPTGGFDPASGHIIRPYKEKHKDADQNLPMSEEGDPATKPGSFVFYGFIDKGGELNSLQNTLYHQVRLYDARVYGDDAQITDAVAPLQAPSRGKASLNRFVVEPNGHLTVDMPNADGQFQPFHGKPINGIPLQADAADIAAHQTEIFIYNKEDQQFDQSGAGYRKPEMPIQLNPRFAGYRALAHDNGAVILVKDLDLTLPKRRPKHASDKNQILVDFNGDGKNDVMTVFDPQYNMGREYYAMLDFGDLELEKTNDKTTVTRTTFQDMNNDGITDELVENLNTAEINDPMASPVGMAIRFRRTEPEAWKIEAQDARFETEKADIMARTRK